MVHRFSNILKFTLSLTQYFKNSVIILVLLVAMTNRSMPVSSGNEILELEEVYQISGPPLLSGVDFLFM